MDLTGNGAYAPRPFRAAWWLRGAHAQTIGGKLLRPAPPVPLRRERWETPDGDFLDLDFVDGAASGPVVLLLHGLEGSARRRYALLAYRALAAAGMRSVGLNFRGCSGEPNRLPRLYHSGETGDVRWAAERLRERLADAPLGAVGFSLGGNVLLKLLGELGESARGLIDAAAAISVPYDLAAGSRRLEQTLLNRHVYTRYFIRMLRGKVRARTSLLAPHCDVDAALRARTLWAFDDAATAPLHGFSDAAEYYARCGAAEYVARIRVPTLLAHADDDPFLPAERVPRAAAQANPHITTAFWPDGGHVGFIEGPPWAPRFWAEEEAARFLRAALLRDS